MKSGSLLKLLVLDTLAVRYYHNHTMRNFAIRTNPWTWQSFEVACWGSRSKSVLCGQNEILNASLPIAGATSAHLRLQYLTHVRVCITRSLILTDGELAYLRWKCNVKMFFPRKPLTPGVRIAFFVRCVFCVRSRSFAKKRVTLRIVIFLSDKKGNNKKKVGIKSVRKARESA